MPRNVLLARARPSWIAASKLVGEAAVILDTLATAISASLVDWLPMGGQQANMQPDTPVANVGPVAAGALSLQRRLMTLARLARQLTLDSIGRTVRAR